MEPQAPRRIDGIVGRIVRAEHGRGSKSERAALFLESPDGRYLLRRKAGPAFGDDWLDKLLGQTVVCSGFLVGGTLLVEDIRNADTG